ncbi:hypothetical protein GA0070607_2119 [Micromonospora coriariae]|uniref:Uncharacterized protein n=1 Tax=Micromonospora coriariae TaxID=285665 RepID=A0A1C4VH32_9ACTN|nr:hypothetical protein [Micromonospora coriariae]SCE83287.1 hypothetical protein GA0070607_2119 [Micromonospora coriariae]
MSRARLLTVVGVLLMLASCLLPCLTIVNGMTLPDQDPTPEAIQQQNADALAFEQRFEVVAWIAAALAILGLAAFIYAWKHRRRSTNLPG